MKVILKQDIKSLGKKDTVVNVSDGYAKNYLLPRGIAVEATAGNLNEVENKQQAIENKQKRDIERAKSEAAQISGKSVMITAKAGENGKLFGAVGSKDIAEAVKEQLNVALDKKKIILDEPIKSAGTYDIEVRIYTGINAQFKVIIDGKR